MDEKLKTAKLQKFVADQVMSNAVREVMETFCLQASKDRDVQNLAARFMAIEILNNAWHELEKYQNNEAEENLPVINNIGL